MINFDHLSKGVEICSAFQSFNAIIPSIPIPQELVMDSQAYWRVASKRPDLSVGPTAFRVDTRPFTPVVDSYFTVPIEINVQSCDQPLAPFGSLDTVWCTAYKATDEKTAWSPTMLFLLDLSDYASPRPESPASDTVIFFLTEFPDYLEHFGLAPAHRSKSFPMHDLTDIEYEKGKATAKHLPRLESSVIYTKSKRD
jgi:hypothetical protein